MMERKNILLIIPNLDFGGAQRSFSKLSLELEKEHNLYVAVFNTYCGIDYPIGGKLVDLNIAGSHFLIGKAYNFFQRVQAVKKIKKDYAIDICISYLEGADYVNILSKGKEQVVISIRGSKVHDGEIQGLMGFLRKKLIMPFIYKGADNIVTVSKGLKTEMVDAFSLNKNKIVTIYNFYEIEELRHLGAEAIQEKFNPIFNYPVIINSGRLHIQKEQAALLKVFAEVRKKAVCKLVLIGDGNLRQELIDLAKSLGLQVYSIWDDQQVNEKADVFFMGYQENPFKFIRRSTVFAFTSSWEGFPNALFEAMVCGVPVISTDCPTGPREILAPGTYDNFSLDQEEFGSFGLLMPLLNRPEEDVKSNNYKVWIKTLTNFIQDKSIQEDLKKKGQLRIADFTTDKIINHWNTLIGGKELVKN